MTTFHFLVSSPFKNACPVLQTATRGQLSAHCFLDFFTNVIPELDFCMVFLLFFFLKRKQIINKSILMY